MVCKDRRPLTHQVHPNLSGLPDQRLFHEQQQDRDGQKDGTVRLEPTTDEIAVRSKVNINVLFPDSLLQRINGITDPHEMS